MNDAHAPNEPAAKASLLALLFGFTAPVDRRTYALVGFTLMALKYAVDAAAIRWFAGEVWTPLDYLSPLRSTREGRLGAEHDLLQLALVLWTLPFLWIGVSMTMRRAADAGRQPALGVLLFFAPILNYAWMLLLCVLPSVAAPRAQRSVSEEGGVSIRRASKAALAAVVVTGAAFAVNVYVLSSYGVALFVGGPLLLGATATVVYNAAELRPLRESVHVTTFATMCVGGALLLFAAEGLLCIAMAMPLAVPMSLFGTLVGHCIASSFAPTRRVAALVPLVWFAASLFEARTAAPALGRATTSVAVAAPREVVWQHVVSFSELPPPDEFYFRLGIAHPLRARIEGQGVGAVRRCEFSTGAFVEPITTWDEPRHLAFDVSAAPAPLVELSPYAELAPPHLEEHFASRRGEFRLHVDGAGTRLEGTTWYELRLGPAPYWRLWSDALVHRIHTRVLEHVRNLAETQASDAAGR